MTRSTLLSILAASAVLAPISVSAHAHLKQALPAPGAKVSGAPSELLLTFTEGVVPALSSIRVTGAAGAAIAAGKPTVDPANAKVLHLKVDTPLAPGAYVVRWHVVALDTHPTSGTYTFTIAP